MKSWVDLPPDIATILRGVRDKKITRAVNIFFLEDGRTMVSVQNPKNLSSYSVEHGDDPLLTLVSALGPPHGGSWGAHLGGAGLEEDDDDDWRDVI